MKIFLKTNSIIQRLHNFAVYIVSAFISLYDPVMVDTVLYQTLKEQFEDESR